jgi:hypothetical protein
VTNSTGPQAQLSLEGEVAVGGDEAVAGPDQAEEEAGVGQEAVAQGGGEDGAGAHSPYAAADVTV